MAVTSTQAVLLLTDLLKGSELAVGDYKVSGGVYAKQRPLDSQKEDVVVNSPTLNREPVQKGLLNVNVYVPNKTYTNGTQQDRTRPDMERLNELATLAEIALSEHTSEDGRLQFSILEDTLFPDSNYQHYLNIRVYFTALNV